MSHTLRSLDAEWPRLTRTSRARRALKQWSDRLSQPARPRPTPPSLRETRGGSLCGQVPGCVVSVPEVDADCGAGWGGTYLDQVADLVDEPESPSCELASDRPPADE
jgi:hypothetical protein